MQSTLFIPTLDTTKLGTVIIHSRGDSFQKLCKNIVFNIFKKHGFFLYLLELPHNMYFGGNSITFPKQVL